MNYELVYELLEFYKVSVYQSTLFVYHFSFYSWILTEILQYWLQNKGINLLLVNT